MSTFVQIKFVKLTESLFEIQSNLIYNVFIELISQATKCKVLISNFKYENPGAQTVMRMIFNNNVCYCDLLLIRY